MARISTSFLLTWLITAVVAMLAWFAIPGTGMDRGAFNLLASQTTKAPTSVAGKGGHASPWRLVSGGGTTTGQLPASIGLKDNLQEIFQSSPHSPIDMAVIFNNLRRLGTQQLSCSVLLAWDEPDAIALTAMENAMAEFESVVLAAPVTRGAITEVMPPHFRRSSLPVESISGDFSSLPLVNRISIPNLIQGGDNSMIGFGVIDSEPTADALHLLARWDDRVIFAFPVVSAAQYLGTPIEDLKIEVGSHIQFGKEGPSIDIDEFGRMSVNFDQSIKTDLLAEDLIDAVSSSPDLPSLSQTLICDLRSHADISTRDFNRVLVPTIARMMSVERETKEMTFARLGSAWEVALLLGVALILSATSLLGRRNQSFICALALAVCVVALWFGLQQKLWLPGISACITTMAAWFCSLVWSQTRKRTTSMPRLDRLGLDAVEGSNPPDKPAEEEDYALAPQEVGIESKHESD